MSQIQNVIVTNYTFSHYIVQLHAVVKKRATMQTFLVDHNVRLHTSI